MPTRKAGSVLLESRSGEYPVALMLDLMSDVVTFRPQPPTVDLLIRDSEGTLKTRRQYTPDFLVILRDGFLVLEYRDEGRLVARNVKNPHQFFMDDEHRWHYRAAEEFFAEMGLRYEVRTNQSLPIRLIENTRFLEDYITAPSLTPHTKERLHGALLASRHISLALLLDSGFTADEVFRGIVEGVVEADLSHQRLGDSGRLMLFSDSATAEVYRLHEFSQQDPPLPIPGTVLLRTGSRISFFGRDYTVILPGECDVVLQDAKGELRTVGLRMLKSLLNTKQLQGDGLRSETDTKGIADIPPAALERALARYRAINGEETSHYARATLARYKRRLAGAVTHLDAIIALVDRTEERGNRERKVSEETERLAKVVVRRIYNTSAAPFKKAAWGKYVEWCELRSSKTGRLITPMSYATFCKRCDTYEDIKARKGRRRAYQEAPILQRLENEVLIHGVRPHEVCYVDHTIATLATVSPEGVNLGKFTYTVAVDGNTAQTRACIVAYLPPSAWTVLMVLRDYVRRHQRLPKILSCDGGADFNSREVEAFCKVYGIIFRKRASGMPRGGAMVERLIGATEEEVFAAMQGNTRQMRDPRLVTKAVNPFRHANLTLKAAYGALEDYLFEFRPNRIHPALGCTPNEYEMKRLRETGARTHMLVRFDENLLLMTAPRRKANWALTLDARRGIQVDGAWYRHPEMDNVAPGTRLDVRMEPWMANVIYVLINGKWVAAVHKNSREYFQRSGIEVEMAKRRARQQSQQSYSAQSVSGKHAARRNAYLDARHFDPRLAIQVREMRFIYEPLSMTVALPPPDDAIADDKPFSRSELALAKTVAYTDDEESTKSGDTSVSEADCAPPLTGGPQEYSDDENANGIQPDDDDIFGDVESMY